MKVNLLNQFLKLKKFNYLLDYFEQIYDQNYVAQITNFSLKNRYLRMILCLDYSYGKRYLLIIDRLLLKLAINLKYLLPYQNSFDILYLKMQPYFERSCFLSEHCLLIMLHHQNKSYDVKVKVKKTNQLNQLNLYSKGLHFILKNSFIPVLMAPQASQYYWQEE